MTAATAWPRWGGSALAVAGLHAAALSVVLYLTPTSPAVTLNEPPALMIELAPLPKPVATPPPAPVAAPIAPAPTPPAPVIAATRPVEKPQPPRPAPPKPSPPKPQPKSEPAQPVAQQPPMPEPTAPTTAPPVARSAAPTPAPASASEVQAAQNWQGRLLQHIARYKRYPHAARRQGEEGVVRIRVRIDGGGNILTQTLTGHCTDTLDQAALQTLQQAQPLPAPPAHLLNNGSVEFVLPFQYSLAER